MSVYVGKRIGVYYLCLYPPENIASLETGFSGLANTFFREEHKPFTRDPNNCNTLSDFEGCITMAEAVIMQKRNILILGRTGAGKRTLANQIVNDSNFFETSNSLMESATREATLVTRSAKDEDRKLLYNIAILDTYSTETSGTKRISQDVSVHSLADSFEGINLVIFAMRKGIYENKELQMFNSIISNLKICEISALVITGCESLDDEERKEVVKEIEGESSTRFIAKSMGKGIFPIGFPPLDQVKAALRDFYQDGIAADSETLKDFATDSGEVIKQMKDVLKKVKEANKIKSSEGFYHDALQNCVIL